MIILIDRHPERIRASIAGSLAGEAAVHLPSGALHMLSVAESLADRGEYDPEDLRARGMASIPPCGPAGILVRVIPYGLCLPADRPGVRRNAYRAALLATVDDGTAAIAVAAAVLAADLLRFDLETALMRVRQTLLEEVPMPVLQRLSPLPPGESPGSAGDPGSALQLAITVLSRTFGVIDALDAVVAMDPQAAVAASLAGALAGCRDGLQGLDGTGGAAWLAAIPAAEAAAVASVRLAELTATSTGSTRTPDITVAQG